MNYISDGILNDEQITAYKKRIRFSRPISITLETLIQLHEAHVLTIPFENLTIKSNLPISLELDYLYEKIIGRKRGGYCFELNGLFYSFLNTIGFKVYPILTYVHFAEENPEQTCHLMGIVILDDEKWLIDVGGGNLIRPIKIIEQIISSQYTETFRIIRRKQSAHEYFLQRYAKQAWRDLYSFNPLIIESRGLITQIAKWNEFYYSASSSVFRNNFMCCLPTKDGKIKLDKDGKMLTTIADNCIVEHEIGKDISTMEALCAMGIDLTEEEINILYPELHYREKRTGTH